MATSKTTTTGAGQRQGENDSTAKTAGYPKPTDAENELNRDLGNEQRNDGSLTDEQKDAQRAFESDDVPEGEAQAKALEALYSTRESEYAASDAASGAAQKVSEDEVKNRPENDYSNPNKPPRKAQIGWESADERDNS